MPETNKLGDIGNQPPGSPFHLKLRSPGWHPDGAGAENLYIGEALLKDAGGTHAAPVPGKAGAPFVEPAPGAPAEDWNKFNEWILGTPLPADPTKDSDFTRFLRELTKRIRRHNASLYRLRRLHFFAHETPVGDPPPRNPFGDPAEDLAKVTPAELAALVATAEKDWAIVVSELNALIDGTVNDPAVDFGFRDVKVDAVEANGYVVSIRVIVGPPGGGAAFVGGSSSSQTPISSLLSSHRP